MKKQNRAFRKEKQLIGSTERVERWVCLVASVAIVLLAVLLAGCGLIRREVQQETSTPPSAVNAVPPTDTAVAPTISVSPPGPAATLAQAAPTPPFSAAGPLFGVQVVVQAGNAPTSVPSPAWLKSLNVNTTVVWMYYREAGGNANAWIDSEKQLVEKMINDTGFQQVEVHIMPNPRPGTGGIGPRFHMPADMTAYSSALTGLARALQPYVRYYSIGNEFSANTWAGTIADYATLLRVSGQAVKAGNPNALILDSGIAAQNYVYPIAKMMVEQGNPNGASTFVQDFLPQHTGPISTAVLATTRAESAMSWLLALFTSLCPYYDVYQLHDYQGWVTMPTVYDWIHSQMRANKCVKPIQAWELGYSLDQNIAIDEQDQAQTVAKIVTISAGEGAQLINYFPLRSYTMFRGIATNDFQLLPAGIAFKTTTGKLAGFTQAARLSLGNNVWGYEFVRRANKVYIVWSTTNSSVTLPFQGGATVTDINGNATRVDSNNIAVGPSIIFVEP
jgi:hypothetical protein